jgi:hypothetical protein
MSSPWCGFLCALKGVEGNANRSDRSRVTGPTGPALASPCGKAATYKTQQKTEWNHCTATLFRTATSHGSHAYKSGHTYRCGTGVTPPMLVRDHRFGILNKVVPLPLGVVLEPRLRLLARVDHLALPLDQLRVHRDVRQAEALELRRALEAVPAPQTARARPLTCVNARVAAGRDVGGPQRWGGAGSRQPGRLQKQQDTTGASARRAHLAMKRCSPPHRFLTTG